MGILPGGQCYFHQDIVSSFQKSMIFVPVSFFSVHRPNMTGC